MKPKMKGHKRRVSPARLIGLAKRLLREKYKKEGPQRVGLSDRARNLTHHVF